MATRAAKTRRPAKRAAPPGGAARGARFPEGRAKDPAAATRRLQMADVARLAGVSVATVSRALSGSPLISADTRTRITELARKLKYSINAGAKNLRLGSSRTISVIIPYDARSRQRVSDPFFLAMLGSLADALTERGFDLLLSRIDADDLGAAATPFDTGVALGIIMIGQWHHHDQLNQLASRGVPIVVWGAQMPRQLYCSVGGDNVSGGAQATRHLLERGRTRIAFVGDTDLPEVAQRYRGYVEALRAHGIAPDARLQLAVPFEVDLARAAVSRLCASSVAFDGVFACSDVLALASIQALRTNGRSVPGSVAVVGYDDIEWASHADPPLTTVRQPIAAAGARIVDALLDVIGGAPRLPITLPVELVVRNSSTP